MENLFWHLLFHLVRKTSFTYTLFPDPDLAGWGSSRLALALSGDPLGPLYSRWSSQPMPDGGPHWELLLHLSTPAAPLIWPQIAKGQLSQVCPAETPQAALGATRLTALPACLPQCWQSEGDSIGNWSRACCMAPCKPALTQETCNWASITATQSFQPWCSQWINSLKAHGLQRLFQGTLPLSFSSIEQCVSGASLPCSALDMSTAIFTIGLHDLLADTLDKAEERRNFFSLQSGTEQLTVSLCWYPALLPPRKIKAVRSKTM